MSRQIAGVIVGSIILLAGVGAYVGSKATSRTLSRVIASPMMTIAPTVVPIATQSSSTAITMSSSSAVVKPVEVSYAGKVGKTALELLQTHAIAEVSGAGTSAFVTGINGRMADNAKKEFWAFYINGKPSQVGAGSYVTKTGDVIEWKIETY
jgi:hypothetical protein